MRKHTRVARVIARLNVGGPAIHTTLLTSRLDPSRFETRLFTGHVGPGEVEMSDLLRREGVSPVRVPGLGRDLRAAADTRALAALVAEFRRFRPHIVHTHTAKAGALGRVAAVLAGIPVRVHTFHGNVFRGYFSPWKSAAVLSAERLLARITTRVVTISEQQRREVTEQFRVIGGERVSVIPLGVDLARVRNPRTARPEFRRMLDVPQRAPLVAWIGRLTEIKAPELALEVAARLQKREPQPVIVFFGGGNLEERMRSLAVDRRLSCVRFAGWHDDIASILAAADALLLTSENEGTPVAVIEALAAGVPVASTDVGGVGDMLRHGMYGSVAACGDADALSDALSKILSDEPLRRRTRRDAPTYAERSWGIDRLIGDIEHLYDELLCGCHSGSSGT